MGPILTKTVKQRSYIILIKQQLWKKMITSPDNLIATYNFLGELGRYPHYITIINTILNYLTSINEVDNDSLLYQSFLESKSIWQSGKESWFSNVNKILKELNTTIEDYDINSVKLFLITKFQKY